MTQWRKSSRSTVSENTDCVELADLNGMVGIRDSKNPETGHITIPPAEFTGLVSRIKRDELTL